MKILTFETLTPHGEHYYSSKLAVEIGGEVFGAVRLHPRDTIAMLGWDGGLAAVRNQDAATLKADVMHAIGEALFAGVSADE